MMIVNGEAIEVPGLVLDLSPQRQQGFRRSKLLAGAAGTNPRTRDQDILLLWDFSNP
jgi:hypothetical protein